MYWADGLNSSKKHYNQHSNDKQPSYYQENFQKKITDLTIDDDLSFENAEIHDNCTSSTGNILIFFIYNGILHVLQSMSMKQTTVRNLMTWCVQIQNLYLI